METENYNNGIHDDFQQALAENGTAKLRFEAMTEPERQALLARSRQIVGLDGQKRLLDELVGFQIGHPPYQL